MSLCFACQLQHQRLHVQGQNFGKELCASCAGEERREGEEQKFAKAAEDSAIEGPEIPGKERERPGAQAASQ